MRDYQGFSLLELLLVMVVLGVLLAVALPAYQLTVVRAHRVAGKVALMDIAARQERYLMTHKRYGTSLTELGLAQNYFVGPTAATASEADAVYRVELAIVDGAFEGARAVPWNGQRRDSDCGTLTLDRLGRRGVLGDRADQPERCW